MKIEFVDYTGSYPNLCSGELILRIDGEIYSFGGYRDDDEVDNHCYSSFWSSGGSAGVDYDGEEFCEEGPWIVSESSLPDWLKPYAQELESIMNENVPHGCCGGCI